MTTSTFDFAARLRAFNEMYRMPVSDKPTLKVVGDHVQRLKDFKKILADELDEIDEIIQLAEQGANETEILTKLADLLGDIKVYVGSEMVKFGIPHDQVLEIIMDSNASKMGADGKPIYDEYNKLQKGPNYWKPEPKIQALLEALAK